MSFRNMKRKLFGDKWRIIMFNLKLGLKGFKWERIILLKKVELLIGKLGRYNKVMFVFD